mmetsp:Transcript_25816/g.85050  ORF Transcript_25816/g.85050 Transcript_25816/m.85050 type:complete len:268 (+) Transcript_25816:988-1791(+)
MPERHLLTRRRRGGASLATGTLAGTGTGAAERRGVLSLLCLPQGEVGAAHLEQLLVRPLLDDRALAQHGDLVRVLDCREAVCNGDRRPLVLRHDAVQRRLHHPLALIVQRRRRLVQQQHRRLANDGASNRHPLLLAARKHASAEAHLRAVAVGEAVHHKAVRVRRPRRLLDLVLRGALLAVANVLRDGALEEHRLLPHQPKLGAEPAQVERADVDTVEGDRAALRVIEALEQRDESRLAAAGRATQRHRLPRADREGVAVAHCPLRR